MTSDVERSHHDPEIVADSARPLPSVYEAPQPREKPRYSARLTAAIIVATALGTVSGWIICACETSMILTPAALGVVGSLLVLVITDSRRLQLVILFTTITTLSASIVITITGPANDRFLNFSVSFFFIFLFVGLPGFCAAKVIMRASRLQP